MSREAEKRSNVQLFLSLRWKMLFLLSAVLIGVHAVYSFIAYEDEKRDFYNERARINDRDQASLDGLVSNSYERMLELAEMLALMSERNLSGKGDIQQVADSLAAHFDEIQLNGALDAAYLFDHEGNLVEGMGMPMEIEAHFIQQVLNTEKPSRELMCSIDCLRYVAIPVQLKDDRLGVLVVGRALIDIVLTFYSEQGRAIGLAFQLAPPDGDLPELGLSLRYLTDKAESLQILRAFSKEFALPKEGGIFRFESNKQYYEVTLKPPLGLEEGVAYWVLIENLTDEYAQLWSDILYSFLLAGCGLVIVALLQFSVLGRPFKSIEKLSLLLPLLSSAEERQSSRLDLIPRQTRFFRDEFDTLVTGVGKLVQGLDSLENDVKARELALEKTATEAKIDRDFTHSLLETAQAVILIQSESGQILSLNAFGQRVLGVKSAQLQERPVYFRDFLGDNENLARELAGISDVYSGRLTQTHSELKVSGAGGGSLDFAWVHSRLPGGLERPPSVLSMGIDITDRKASERRIYWLANNNPLTALPNRHAFSNALINNLSLLRGQSSSFAVLLCGLDGFKGINDSIGHEFGDHLLKDVAKRFSETLKEEGMVAHFSSDQFMLLSNVHDPSVVKDEVDRVARKVLTAFRRPFVVSGFEIYTTMSVGVSFYPEHGRNGDDLLRHADIAMFQVKEQGKNHHRYYDTLLGAEQEERFTLKSDLYRAVEREQLVLFYQPQVDAKTGKLIGLEALIRWHHPTAGLISPGQFVPLAEETGLIWEIGTWVLSEACQQLMAWREQGLDGVKVSVNLAKHQLFHELLIPTVVEVLEDAGLAPELLDIEITENFLMKQPNRVLPKLEKLRDLGISISMDDFGTGFSSLSHLRDLPIDRIKIDKSFIHDVATDRKAQAVVESVIVLGHSLGLSVLAEGVETREQLEFLQTKSCHEIQGYYFSHPLPAFDVLEFKQRLDNRDI